MSAPSLRVVQWATGNIGSRALREVIRHPGLELVGVLVHDAEKVGVDAGDLCGEDPTGVLATDDRAVIRSLGADCVLYMPRAADVDDVVALLESGTNLVTTCGVFFDDGRRLGDDRARVLAACARGPASVYATGSSPGFITDALPFALLSLQRRVESLTVEEFANLSRRDSPHLLFELMGFGRPLDTFDGRRRASHLLAEFGPPLRVLAEAAGLRVDSWTASGEVATARRDTSILAGDIAAGSVAAQRTTIMGSTDGVDIVRFTPTWYCTDELEPAWDLLPTGWRVRVRGDAPFDVELAFPIPLDDLGSFTPAYTANRPVNAVPYVCDARPGILSTADLPPITPAGPRRGEG